MKKICITILLLLCVFFLSGCTIKMSEDDADENEEFLEWLGFERCEVNCE